VAAFFGNKFSNNITHAYITPTECFEFYSADLIHAVHRLSKEIELAHNRFRNVFFSHYIQTSQGERTYEG